MNTLRAVVVMSGALLMFGQALAATFAVDDSGTVASPSLAEARWVKPGGARGLSFDVEATVRVDVRLNLRPWFGRQANIYMSAPRNSTVPFKTTWTSNGRLLPGTLTQGARALVWTGKIAESTLADVMMVTLTADGRTLAVKQALEFGFEIDLEQGR